MSGQSAPQPATSGSSQPVREGLADPEVMGRLTAFVRVGLGRRRSVPVRQRNTFMEEVLAEVCSRALAAERRYDPARSSVLSWVGGFIWKVLRERRKGRPGATTGLDPTTPDPGPSVPEVVADRLDSADLLAQLPPGDRQLFVWVAQGWTAAEIGAELGLTAAAVRVRLHRARALARQRLGVDPTEGPGHD